MNKLKKILIALIISFTLFNLGIALVFAAETPITRLEAVGEGANYGTIDETSLPHAAGQVIKVFLGLLGVIFISYTVYAGWAWMTAAGNDEKIMKAKKTIRGSVIGLIIAMSAYIITATVVDRLLNI